MKPIVTLTPIGCNPGPNGEPRTSPCVNIVAGANPTGNSCAWPSDYTQDNSITIQRRLRHPLDDYAQWQISYGGVRWYSILSDDNTPPVSFGNVSHPNWEYNYLSAVEHNTEAVITEGHCDGRPLDCVPHTIVPNLPFDVPVNPCPRFYCVTSADSQVAGEYAEDTGNFLRDGVPRYVKVGCTFTEQQPVYEDQGASCVITYHDGNNEDVSGIVTDDSDDVDPSIPGAYTIQYSCDPGAYIANPIPGAELAATQATRNINIGNAPTVSPTLSPTDSPTHSPTHNPTHTPAPTHSPTSHPTFHPCDDGTHGCAVTGGICRQDFSNGAASPLNGWFCDCEDSYYCTANCEAPYAGHTCTPKTAVPTPVPTPAPTPCSADHVVNFEIQCEVEDTTGGTQLVHDVSLGGDTQCAEHIVGANGLDCDWTCRPGWYRSMLDNTCLLPRAPILSIHGLAAVTLEASNAGRHAEAGWTDLDGASCTRDPFHCPEGSGLNCTLDVIVSNMPVQGVIGSYAVGYTCMDPIIDVMGEYHNGEYFHEHNTQVYSRGVRQVTVQDLVPPVCDFDSDHPSTVTIEASFPYEPADLAPLCTDNCGFSGVDCIESSESAVQITNDVDVEEVGTYTVTFGISDLASNPAIKIVRTVIVIDSLKPVIGLAFSTNSIESTHHTVSDGGTLGEHQTATGGHADYGLQMAKSGYAPSRNMWGRANPAGSHFLAETSSANVFGVLGLCAAVAGVAIFAKGSKTTPLKDLV